MDTCQHALFFIFNLSAGISTLFFMFAQQTLYQMSHHLGSLLIILLLLLLLVRR